MGYFKIPDPYKKNMFECDSPDMKRILDPSTCIVTALDHYTLYDAYEQYLLCMKDSRVIDLGDTPGRTQWNMVASEIDPFNEEEHLHRLGNGLRDYDDRFTAEYNTATLSGIDKVCGVYGEDPIFVVYSCYSYDHEYVIRELHALLVFWSDNWRRWYPYFKPKIFITKEMLKICGPGCGADYAKLVCYNILRKRDDKNV